MPDSHSRETPYPSSRKMTFDVAKVSHNKHYLSALLEVDVTDTWKPLMGEKIDHHTCH